MATSIGNLAVILSADTRQYGRGMGRASNQAQSFSFTVKRSMARVVSAVGTLGALVVGGGAISLFTRQLQRLDDVAKTASKLGVTTEELTRLQFAGEQTGVAITTTNMAIQRMTRRVAEAAKGTGEAKGALKELGLDAVALNKMGPAKAFAEIADAMQAVENQGDRVRLSMKLFDSEGVALVNTLAGGSDALKEYADTSDRLGNTATPAAAAAAERLTSAVNRMKVSIGGIAVTFADTFGPSLQKMIDGITGAIVSLRTMDKVALKNKIQFGALVAGFAAGVAIAPKIIAAVKTIITVLKGLAKASAIAQAFAGPAGIVSLVAGAAAAVLAMGAVEMAFDSFGNEVEDVTPKVAEVAKEIDHLGQLSDRIMGTFAGTIHESVETPIEDVGTAIMAMSNNLDNMASRAASIFDATRTPAERLAAKIKEITELAGLGLLDPETARRALSDANGQRVGQDAFDMQSRQPTQRVSFAAMGASAAAGRQQSKIEKNTGEEVKESKKQTAALADLLRATTNSQGAAITVQF